MLTEQVSCEICESSEFVHDQVNGEIVCAHCGIVRTGDILFKGPEWRAFTLSETAKRERATPTPYPAFDGGFYTKFRGGKDANGSRLSPDKVQKWRRLRRFDIRAKSNDNKIRNMNQATSEIERYCDRLHLPHRIREEAIFIYRKSLNKDLIRGRTISDFVSAAIYAACRESRIPRSLADVSRACGRKVKDVSRTYRLLLKELGLKMPIDDPMKFVPKIASSLKIDIQTERESVKNLREAAEKKVLIGKDPRSMATAALYLACKNNRTKMTQKRLADAAGISTVSLRNRLKELEAAIHN
ncbi:MAG: TFIIB-type zinc ribbon-containing protein [Candidatus Bathyarchaeota archaeon]|jgi:transcription initiation factor TFIIB